MLSGWGLLLACTGAPAPEPTTGSPAQRRPADPPPTAAIETWRSMVEDLEAPRHASDGGGALALVTVEPEGLQVGTPARIHLRYTVGPLGVAEGGALVFQPPPFWGWSPPQTAAPDAPGAVDFATDADGVHLEAQAGAGLAVATVRGRALAAGEQVDIVYGAGAAGTVVDRFAEHGAQLWIGVDGDGDGIRALVEPPVTVDVAAGPPVGVLATLPSVAEPGDTVVLKVAVLDARGNAFGPWAGAVGLSLSDGLTGPDSVTLDERGLGEARLVASAAGIHHAAVQWGEAPAARTNPLVVREGAPPILWGDLQIHTGLSDGTGSLDDVYRYARDVAALDVAAPTDHDHWGLAFLDTHPELWEETQAAAARWYEPGTFVSAPGFEWTNWVSGHRHVIYFADSGPLLSSLDPATDRPDELWRALEGRPAVTIAHHSAGGPVAVDWRYPPDPVLEPVTEICSVHGQSEAWETPGRIYDPVRGNFVHDVLRGGARLGFLGSTDGHDGHPGLSHLAGPHGGLAAIGATAHTREAVLEALRARRVYATNGVRIVLRADVSGVGMGGTLKPADAAELTVRAVGTAPIERIEVVRRTGVDQRVEGIGSVATHQVFPLADLEAGDFVYVRVHQVDGGRAWSSPVFVSD